MKKQKLIIGKLYVLMSKALTSIAVNLAVKPASIFEVYQPKAPKSIK